MDSINYSMTQYLADSKRTASTSFYPERVSYSEFSSSVFSMGLDLDLFKKALFYGKGNYREKMYGVYDSFSMEEFFTDSQLDREYSREAQIDILHSLMGILTESIEISEAVHMVTDQDSNHNGLNMVNLKEEIGDILWYIAMFCRATNTSFEELAHKNIQKLKVRFPEKFTEDLACNRNLDKELEVLKK